MSLRCEFKSNVTCLMLWLSVRCKTHSCYLGPTCGGTHHFSPQKTSFTHPQSTIQGWKTMQFKDNDVDDVHIFFSYKRIFTKETCMLKIMLLVYLKYINIIFLAKWHYIIWLALIIIVLPFLLDRCMDYDIWRCSLLGSLELTK